MFPFNKLFPDAVPHAQIAVYLLKRTGVRVTKHRITRWINNGEIPLIRRPRQEGGGLFTRKCYLDKLIEKYS